MAIDLLSYVVASTSYFPVTTLTVVFAVLVTLCLSYNSLGYFSVRMDTMPLLRYESSALARYVIKKCPKLSQQYSITGIWTSGHAQTFLNQISIFHEKESFRRLYVQMKDGGCIALDIYCNGTSVRNSPVLIVIPTVTGDTSSAVGICREARGRGFRPIIYNRRGQSKSYLTTPFFQVLGTDTDLRQIINYIKVKYPCSNLTAVSLGLGSGLLLSYLGEYGSSSKITAACCISPVFDFKSVYWDSMSRPYKLILLQKLKSILFRHANCYSDETIQRTLRTGNLLEFDRIVSGRKQSLSDYWEAVNPLRDIDDISCPVLFISAADDPICESAKIPDELFTSTPHFFSCLTESGGHCGFRFARDCASKPDDQRQEERRGSWAEELAVDYILTVLRFLKLEERSRTLSGIRNPTV